jgi:hypothetical protein
MQSVTVSRVVEADSETLAELVTDVGPFMRAAGFDEVTVDGDRFRIHNHVGLLTIELDLEVVESDAALAYEQREGIFESMETRYELDEREDGTELRATTTFALDVALVGEILDATVIKRQRRKELTAQFDYLEEETAGP